VTDSADCAICLKQRGEGLLGGELVGRWDGFAVYHAAPGSDGLAALGHLFIESERHAPYVADLTDAEAAALGRLRTRVARALREALDPQVVVCVVIGLGMAHFHENLIARPRDTPREVPWYDSDEAAPRADADRVRALARQLEAALSR
jgi:diadenosine tetraphosphate (Ap4A) HIT family hydrolase